MKVVPSNARKREFPHCTPALLCPELFRGVTHAFPACKQGQSSILLSPTGAWKANDDRTPKIKWVAHLELFTPTISPWIQEVSPSSHNKKQTTSTLQNFMKQNFALKQVGSFCKHAICTQTNVVLFSEIALAILHCWKTLWAHTTKQPEKCRKCCFDPFT